MSLARVRLSGDLLPQAALAANTYNRRFPSHMPRTLAAALRRLVLVASRNRGEAYFHDGRVSPLRSDATTFIAAVRGTHAYEVSLLLDDDRLVVECTCPYFEGSREPCKHVWAAILAADAARVFQVPPDLWLDSDGTDIDRRARSGARRSPANAAGPSGPRAARAAIPAWQTFLSRVSPAAETHSPRTLPTGELIYLLDLTRSGHGWWAAGRGDDTRAEEVRRVVEAQSHHAEPRRHRPAARCARPPDPRRGRRRRARARVRRPGLGRAARARAVCLRAQPDAAARSHPEALRDRPPDAAPAGARRR